MLQTWAGVQQKRRAMLWGMEYMVVANFFKSNFSGMSTKCTYYRLNGSMDEKKNLVPGIPEMPNDKIWWRLYYRQTHTSFFKDDRSTRNKGELDILKVLIYRWEKKMQSK